jgi:hypothetical protein
MLSYKRCLPFVVVAVLLAWNTAWADDEAAKEPAGKAEAAPAAADIGQLIEQLDADRFTDRQTASQKLALQGKTAIPALAKAAVGDSLEVTTRAIDILRKFYENSDAVTKEAAKAALETIAKSDRPSAARRAQEVLKPKVDPNVPENVVPGGGIIFGGGAIIQGNIQVGGAAVKKMSVKNANGVKDIDVEDGDKKIKIHDDPKNGIKIEVTTKKDGKDVTDKYEAKDADELKKKHPEGYKVYEEYGKNAGGAGGAIQIQIGGGNIIPGVPMPVPAAPIQPRAINAGRNDVALAIALLRNAIQRLERLTKQEGLKDATQESKDELKKQMGEMKRIIADLEKQLQDGEKPEAKPAEQAERPAAEAKPEPAGEPAKPESPAKNPAPPAKKPAANPDDIFG